MNFVKHPSNNVTLEPPRGHDQSTLPVLSLPVTRTQIEGVTCVQSFWLPEPEELAALVSGAPVVLSVMGHTMPPVMLFVEAQQVPSTAAPEWLAHVLKTLEENHQHHQDHDEYDGYPGSDLEEQNLRALAAVRAQLQGGAAIPA